MLEGSKQNIQLAKATKDSNILSKALEVHKKILGDKPKEVEMPDMSKIEQHSYPVQLPKGLPEMLLELLSSGQLNLSAILPANLLNKGLDNIEDAKIVE